jgi:mRNA interferase MazF
MNFMKISRGDIWLTNFDPVLGREIAKTRPALVISHSAYNAIADTVSVIPISSGKYIRSFHVMIKKLKKESHAVLPQLRPADKNRLIRKIGKASETELTEVKEKLLRYLDLR